MTASAATPAAAAAATASAHRALLDSPELGHLVARRWRVSLLLTAALSLAYYGFVLLVALDKELLARRVGETTVTTLGIPLGAAVIVVAFVLTALYVRWANRVYDPMVDRLLHGLERDSSRGGNEGADGHAR